MLADRIRLGSGKRGQPLSNLAVGDKIKFGRYQVASETAQEIIWVVAAKNHTSYPANSVTLITEKIIDLRCFDAKEPSNPNTSRQKYGNSRYSISNLDQWLNKDSAAGSWYVAAHAYDQIPNASNVISNTPYDTKTGFLTLFSPYEKSVIQNTTIRVVKSSIDGAGYEDITRKIFLPSKTEVGLGNENSIPEGAVWSYFNTAGNQIAYLTQQAFDNTPSTSKPSAVGNAWLWWVRTPKYDSNGVWAISPTGETASSYFPYSGNIGIRPAINLPGTTLVKEV